MPTTVSQKIFDQLLDTCICSPDAAGWTLDSAGTRPSVTVTAEVVLALIDAAMSSAIVVPADFPKRLKGPIEFIMADVLARDTSTLDLANYIRALSAYLFHLRFITPPGTVFTVNEKFKNCCIQGISDKFAPGTASLVERWLYVNGCKDILEAGGNEFSVLRQSSEMARRHLDDEAGRDNYDPYEAAIYLDALTPRRLSIGHPIAVTNGMRRCVELIAQENGNYTLAQVKNDRPDSYKVYTPAFVIKSFAMLRPSLDEKARRFFYEMIEAVYENVISIPQNFRLAHLLRGFVHAGIEPEDAQYIGNLLKENDGLREARTRASISDIDAIETATEKKLVQVGRPRGWFFAAVTPFAYYGLFGGIFVVSYLLMRLSTNKPAFLISVSALLVSAIFIAFQAYKVDREWHKRTNTEKVPLLALFVIFVLLAALDVVSFIAKADESLFSQWRKIENFSLQSDSVSGTQRNVDQAQKGH